MGVSPLYSMASMLWSVDSMNTSPPQNRQKEVMSSVKGLEAVPRLAAGTRNRIKNVSRRKKDP